MPPGSGQGAYSEAFHRVILPALHAFQPEMLFISSGYDAAFFDPLASMMLGSQDFRYFMSMMVKFANEKCHGRMFVAHEGGYSKEVVPFCGLAVLEEMTTIPSGVSDPFAAEVASLGEQDLQPHQDARIKECEGLLANLKDALASQGR